MGDEFEVPPVSHPDRGRSGTQEDRSHMKKDLRAIHMVIIIIILLVSQLLLQQLTLGYFLCDWLCSKQLMHINLFNLENNSMKLLLLLSSSHMGGKVDADLFAEGGLAA